MQLTTAQNNLSESLFLAISQWESRLPVIKEGVREFFDAVPRIMHFFYSIAVLAWYTVVALGALVGYLAIGLVYLMRRSLRLGKKARQLEFVVRAEAAVRPVARKYALSLVRRVEIAAHPMLSVLHFAKNYIKGLI